MEHVPTFSSVTAVAPETKHTKLLLDVKVTGRPEVAVAVRVTVPALSRTPGGWGNRMDCWGARARRTLTLLPPILTTTRSARPSPLKSPTATKTGDCPTA